MSLITANITDWSPATLRLLSMLLVLVTALSAGFYARKREVPEIWAKKIMMFVVVVLNWPVALFVIWKMKLDKQYIWLPVITVLLMLAVALFSTLFSSLLKLNYKSRFTFILASSLSNLSYTGGAFVCYAMFGQLGLGLANLYIIFWLPTAYLVFFPILKIREMKNSDQPMKFSFNQIFDARYIVLPAIFIALLLNWLKIPQPQFIQSWHIIDFFIYSASFLAFFAIGLRVKVSRLKNYLNLYFPLACVKFIVSPVIAGLLIWILAMTGTRLSDIVIKVIIILSVTPCAVMMVMISNVFDLDSKLASALWVVNTAVFALIVVPILFMALN